MFVRAVGVVIEERGQVMEHSPESHSLETYTVIFSIEGSIAGPLFLLLKK